MQTSIQSQELGSIHGNALVIVKNNAVVSLVGRFGRKRIKKKPRKKKETVPLHLAVLQYITPIKTQPISKGTC